ncbi:ABC transporter ATP-binding protein [Cryobacterium psychrophilum]|uniref:ABC-type quaternary amine transporter n=1 Tax=Cryobacterium psychrophilum TaxID=41988 RepID=A0A4Y8KKX1_9MICO|nr:ABC transporter ATP-binding protein [Cryobacterium psychrophilum]TDW30262.1 iron(III) transport system ATP-binding protein [Cryobacterium psychrophilum]TFD77482.1 ABC transporter ATP-binding protein [Cryobacterium psychrophilum]
MTWVTVQELRVSYDETDVLENIDLAIPRGSLVAVLGPSGCGKTTLLRAIAGLLPASAGTITVADRVVSAPGVQLAPEKRGMGWVPQDASLFPHLSVGENIGFGLPHASRADRAKRTARIAELAELVGLAGFVDRAPSQLSGGQAQRVSLARALAPRPDLMLLDEPFAALDPLLRGALRSEVAALLRDQKSTSLLVTHDQEEALSLADFVAVMRDGGLLQWGTPAEVYENPVSFWVAAFVGDTVELEGTWSDGRVECALGSIAADAVDGGTSDVDGTPVRLMLRPEWIHLSPAITRIVSPAALPASSRVVAPHRSGLGIEPAGTERITATVMSIAYGGHDALVSLELLGGAIIRARVAAPDLPKRGDRVRVSIRRPALAYPLD